MSIILLQRFAKSDRYYSIEKRNKMNFSTRKNGLSLDANPSSLEPFTRNNPVNVNKSAFAPARMQTIILERRFR